MLELAPPIILVFSYLGAALIVAEVGLPTAGLIGATGLAASALAFANAFQQDRAAWPLVLPLIAASTLGLLLMRRRKVVPLEFACAAALAIGSIAWGIANDSPASIAIGIVIAAATPFGYAWLHASTRRLLDSPKLVGLDALIGGQATIATWDQADNSGSVRVDGSLWIARIEHGEPIQTGAAYIVAAHDRMTLLIRRKETP